jgi:CRISPR-associated protein Cst2
LIQALAATLLKPAGAQRNTQNPHIVNCESVIATSATSLPAPAVSPLHDNYRDEMKKAAAVLNTMRSGSVRTAASGSLAEGISLLASLAEEIEFLN